MVASLSCFGGSRPEQGRLLIIEKGGVALQDWVSWGFLIVAALVAFFLIRVLIQLTKLSKDLETTLKSLEVEIVPLVHNLKEVSDGVNRLMIQVEERVKQTEPLFKAIAESAGIVATINRVLKGGVASPLINMACLSAGVLAAGKTFFKHKKKGG
jgi:uncharacterized protein YoxC